jgi:glycosyltransferase involved in cell wall biosynthesis
MPHEHAAPPKVSVIIPVYNIEPYLRRSLESVLAQTLADIEVIVVDDGSTDASGRICDEYARSDGRVTVIHQANAGISAARNAGLERARGNYLGFVDGDDMIEPDMYAYLYDLALRHDADVVQCGVYDCYEDEVLITQDEDYFELTDGRTLLQRMLESRGGTMHVYNKIYRRSSLGKVRFHRLNVAEDVRYLADVAPIAERAVVTSRPKYYYLHRPGSATSSDFDLYMADGIGVYDQIYDEVAAWSTELRQVAAMRRCYCRLLVLDKMYLSKSGFPRELERDIVRFERRHWRDLLRRHYVTRSREVAFVALLINKRLYRAIVRAFYARNRRVA